MEKVVVSEKTRENVKFSYNGVEIEVNPYITIEEEISLISNYVNTYFYPSQDVAFGYLKEGSFDYWQANYGLIQKIMQDKTNVNVDFEKTNANEMVELFYEVVTHISNYSQFKARLNKTVDAIKDSKSIGVVIDSLMSKGTELLQSFSNIDPEQLKSLADNIIGKIESSSVAPIFQESAKQTVITKQSKPKKVKENKE